MITLFYRKIYAMKTADLTEFYVVRHGQTAANLQAMIQGQQDTLLDETGELQVNCLAEFLKDAKFDIVYVSDLKRTRATAAAIMQYHPDTPVFFTPELREWHLGALEGRSFAELNGAYPLLMQQIRQSSFDAAPPEGESMPQFQERINRFMEKIASEHPNQKILLVTHGGVLQRIFNLAVGVVGSGNLRPLCHNASLSVFQRRNAQWQLAVWNNTSFMHLTSANDTITL